MEAGKKRVGAIPEFISLFSFFFCRVSGPGESALASKTRTGLLAFVAWNPLRMSRDPCPGILNRASHGRLVSFRFPIPLNSVWR